MTRARPGALAGLLVAPGLLAAGFAAAPLVHPSDAVADAVAAAWTSLAVVAALAIADLGAPSTRARLASGLVAAALLIAVAVSGAPTTAAVVGVGLALTTLGHVVGGAIGARIAHPGHVAPACAIAAGADLASVLSPEGPSHAIASSEAAISVLVVAGPVPGHPGASAPTIGLGDLVFIALLLAAASAHHAPRWRVVMAVATGVAASLTASALLHAPIPALPAIGVATVLAVPAFRDVRPRDRGAATFGVVVGCALAIGATLRAWLT